MKVQLFLANQEIELTNNVQIPLNKTFENTINPSDIIVDYSKNIQIPMTTTNNKVLGSAYRLDKNVISNSSNDNIGIYLDPTKKIPFTLLYNGELMMVGYAKFVSANYSATNKFYNMNLFSMLGEYFQKMKDVVVSNDKLTDEQKLEGNKYILNDHLKGNLNADYVYKSWLNENNNINDFTDATITDQDIIGFAPSYRGYYGLDFKSDTVQTGDYTTYPLADFIKGDNETVDIESYIKDGLKDYQMDEYRSYHQRPYIYINKLIYMFQEKSKELTGYDLVLDPKWFNQKNPYWAKLVYLLNFLEDLDSIEIDANIFVPKTINMPLNRVATNECYGTGKISYKFVPHSNTFDITRFLSCIKFSLDNTIPKLQLYSLEWAEKAAIVWTFTLTDSNGNKQVKKFWSSNGGYTPSIIDSSYVTSHLIPVFPYYGNTYHDTIESIYYQANDETISFNIPDGLEEREFTMDMSASFYSPSSSPLRMHINQFSYEPSAYIDAWGYYDYITATYGVENCRVSSGNAIKLGLNLLYLEENPIFDIVLQYTKMFGLMWRLDNVNKKVEICRKSTYFKDYTIEDWGTKLDRSKDYIIEPITFESKYVNFNYEDIEGYKYTNYKDKYGFAYGTKKLKTSYEFDSDDKNLFSGIYPSMISQRTFVKYTDLTNWVANGKLNQTTDFVPRIESVDKDDETAINHSGWYFRKSNTPTSELFITDDSQLMLEKGESCWYSKNYLSTLKETSPDVKSISSIPQLSPVIESNNRMFGCLFNCPNEDYTVDGQIGKCKNRYIYDNVWNDFINERYSVNNKKLTAYFNIHPWEYISFDFNKFVTIDNQLFMINKIFDYDLNSTATTKCELIQISNIHAYTSDTIDFEKIQ